MMIGLTAPQQAALSFIRTYRDEHGLMPSCAEIAAGIGAKSKSRASQVLASLEERGAPFVGLAAGRERSS